MDKETSSTSSGIGFFGLTIVFITLKLFGVIDWAWMWVLAPLWLPVALAAGIYVVFLIIMVIKTIIRERNEKHS